MTAYSVSGRSNTRSVDCPISIFWCSSRTFSSHRRDGACGATAPLQSSFRLGFVYLSTLNFAQRETDHYSSTLRISARCDHERRSPYVESSRIIEEGSFSLRAASRSVEVDDENSSSHFTGAFCKIGAFGTVITQHGSSHRISITPILGEPK